MKQLIVGEALSKPHLILGKVFEWVLVIDDGYNQNLEGEITLTFDDNNDR